MKTIRLFLRASLVVAAAGAVCAVAGDSLDDFQRKSFAKERPAEKPAVDVKQAIAKSNSFLKEREPEMTTEEYAIYEKVVTLLGTNAGLAIKMLEAMSSEKEKPSPAFEFILANAYAAAGQTARAETLYRGAVDRYPTFLRAWNNLALLHYAAGKFAEAATCFSKAVALGDRDSATLGLLGYCLEQQDARIPAEAAYLQALGADPTNTDWKEGLFRLALGGKQYGRAEELGRNLIRERPTEIRLWLNYAGALVAGDRKLEAMAVLEQAQTVVALDAETLVLLGDLYAEQGLAREAAEVYRKVLATDRARGERKLLQFASSLVASGQFAEAERVLASFTGDLSPAAHRVVLQARADLNIARQRWPEARRELEALLAQAPLDGRALLALGRTYLEENNLPRAALAYESAEQVPESAYQAGLELANLEIKNRHYAKAAGHLEKALQLRRTDAVEAYLVRVRSLIPPDEAGR